jgi:2-oxoglutarate dehydrogenase E1 component
VENDNHFKQVYQGSYFSGGNIAYLEQLYEDYLTDPQAVPLEWRETFERLPKQNGAIEVSHESVRQNMLALSKQRFVQVSTDTHSKDADYERKQANVMNLINAYRRHGHKHAQLDPLGSVRPTLSDLTLTHHGLSESDRQEKFNISTFAGIEAEAATLDELLVALNQIYCATIGIEYMYITDPAQEQWLQQRIEVNHFSTRFSVETKKEILKYLTAAEGIEHYLARKYVGQKRFSLEGSDSLIPMLNHLVQRAGGDHVKEVVVGMAHRGRLNVLVNVLGKAPKDLFQEFEGKSIDHIRTGDVKYHLGFSSDVSTSGEPVHLVLGFNPSHLEIISPVIEGSVRARQERRGDALHEQVVPIIIHGDAAFAGQGVVMETFNMSQARGYRTGGTIHIVINNQIGFTTSNLLDARSTEYCTDVAKMIQAPVLHVNADDPEAVLYVAAVAFDYRMKFKRDVVIDLVCYRRHGHNESDEPMMTQPLMYQTIKQHPTVVTLYRQKLINEAVLTEQQAEQMVEHYKNNLTEGNSVVHLTKHNLDTGFIVNWSPYLDREWTDAYDSKESKNKLVTLANALLKMPDGFELQRQVANEFDARRKMTTEELPIHWGYAETLAYATLLDRGYAVRISGQDSGRGTFSHRHAVLHDCNNGQIYIPLTQVAAKQGRFTVIDSILSEEGVLGYEYGFATAEPESLTIWEGQFGDFVNGAQVVIDQFISSGDQKWGRLCGLVMLLPHGYEGMGPEHSSARLERFLQLCAQNNMQVCVPSTPAQCYHMLRRQMLRPYRKPLIVMTPKSILRHKLAVSTLDELASGTFQLVLPELDNINPKKVTRVVICSGKVYYDLLQQRRDENRDDIAIIRVEQLYPFPIDELKQQLQQYSHAKKVIWCQEEPRNQGAWYCTQHHFTECLQAGQVLEYAGREAAAAPAVGYPALHVAQQQAFVKQALHN